MLLNTEATLMLPKKYIDDNNPQQRPTSEREDSEAVTADDAETRDCQCLQGVMPGLGRLRFSRVCRRRSWLSHDLIRRAAEHRGLS